MTATLSLPIRRPSRTRAAAVVERPAPVPQRRTESPPSLTRDDLEAAVQQFGPRLHAVARRYFSCDADADDAVQDALVSAVRHLAEFRSGSRLETWLHRIVVNACLMKLRSQRRRPTVPLNDNLDPLPDNGPTPQEREETHHAVRAALLQLTESQRTVIQLRYFEGFNTAQTAELLGLTREVVKTRLHRSCRALQRALEANQRD